MQAIWILTKNLQLSQLRNLAFLSPPASFMPCISKTGERLQLLFLNKLNYLRS